MTARILVLASTNEHKVSELEQLLDQEGLVVELRTLAAYDGAASVDEDGKTFAENAAKKALFAGVSTGEVALADDSGLEVEHLGGLPGVRSARYAGAAATDEANNIKLLTALREVPREERSARFRSAVAVFEPERGASEGAAGEVLENFWREVLEREQLRKLDQELASTGGPIRWNTPWGSVVLVGGTCSGRIVKEPRGDGGFGYDPIFYCCDIGKTFGEVRRELKNEHSHRARAFEGAVEVLRGLFDQA